MEAAPTFASLASASTVTPELQAQIDEAVAALPVLEGSMRWKGCIILNYYNVGARHPYILAVGLLAFPCAETSQPLYIQAENSELQTIDCSPLSRLSTRHTVFKRIISPPRSSGMIEWILQSFPYHILLVSDA